MPNVRHATILIVDDTPENLRVLGEILQPLHTVRVANSGARALEIAATDPRPDLILLDVMMPHMDGYECLARLRADPRTADIPAIFVTALDSDEDERRGLALGAVDYIAKPVRPAIVLARVRTHLDLKWARAWLKQQNAFLEDELNRFLEILAHHLQEPVRQHITVAQKLQRSIPRPLGEDAELSLSQVMEGAARLRSILHDVLLYLSVQPVPPPATLCSAEAALDAVRARLSERITATHAQVTHAGLPMVRMDPKQLADVFRILLDNALDYCCPDRPPRIRVEGETKNGRVILSVEDNGIGIPAEFRERLFRVFERLAPDDGRPGAGIGLALARKIVEGVGGRVWIEDGGDGGSRFRFSVPLAGAGG